MNIYSNGSLLLHLLKKYLLDTKFYYLPFQIKYSFDILVTRKNLKEKCNLEVVMKRLFITLSFVMFVSLLISQNPPDVLWTKTIGGIGYEEAFSIDFANDNGYIIAGLIQQASETDIILVRTNTIGETIWIQTFGEIDKWDQAYSVQQVSDGGFILAGKTKSYGAEDYDAFLLKTDENGNELWHQIYGDYSSDYAWSAQQTADNGYILAGMLIQPVDGDQGWLIKTDANGDTLWTQEFGSDGNDILYSVQQTADNGYISAGYTNSFGVGTHLKVWLIKTNEYGDTLWTNTFSDTQAGSGFCVKQTNDLGFIITGCTYSYSPNEDIEDVWLIKTDASGDLEWSQTFGGTGFDIGRSVAQCIDGGYIIAGYSNSFSNGNYDVYIIKTDEYGNEEWNKVIGGADHDRSFSILQKNNGNYNAVGYTNSYGAGLNDIYLFELGYVLADFVAYPTTGYLPLVVYFSDQSIGNILSWQWDFNNDGIIDSYNQNPNFTYNQIGTYSVALTISDGTNEDTMIKENYISVLEPVEAEFSGFPLHGSCPLEVNFMDMSSGNITSWLWDFDNDGFIDSNEQNPIHIYNEVGIFTVLLTVSDGTTEDTEIKEDYVLINPASSDYFIIPSKTQLYENYPNPFNPITSMRFDIKGHETGILSIFNLKGQLIESNFFESGQHNYMWDASEQSSGIYFYKLQTQSITETRKMILLK